MHAMRMPCSVCLLLLSLQPALSTCSHARICASSSAHGVPAAHAELGLQSAVEILMVPVAALAVSHAPASPLYGYSSSVAKPLLIAYSMPYGPLAPQSMSCSTKDIR